MTPQDSSTRRLIAAITWTVAAAVMAAGMIAVLPIVAPLPALVFGLCATCAICWWGGFIQAKKRENKEKKGQKQ